MAMAPPLTFTLDGSRPSARVDVIPTTAKASLISMRSIDPTAFFRVRYRDGSQSRWIFARDGELHRNSLYVLKRYGASTQQTYAYSLLDHLNWLERAPYGTGRCHL
jgi:hypothetical protein